MGKIGAFQVEFNNWTLYAERLEQYFLVNNVKDELKVPTLITVMGRAGYELLVTLRTSDKNQTLLFGFYLAKSGLFPPKYTEKTSQYTKQLENVFLAGSIVPIRGIIQDKVLKKKKTIIIYLKIWIIWKIIICVIIYGNN